MCVSRFWSWRGADQAHPALYPSMALAICFLVANPNLTRAQELDNQGKILNIQENTLDTIANTAERICNKAPPLDGRESRLSESAKAELDGLFRWLAQFGVKLSVDYSNSYYKGLLQMDLAKAIKDNTDCKLAVFFALLEKMFAKTADAMPTTITPATINSNLQELQAIIRDAILRSTLGQYDQESLQLFEIAYKLLPASLARNLDQAAMTGARQARANKRFAEASAYYVRAFQAIATPD